MRKIYFLLFLLVSVNLRGQNMSASYHSMILCKNGDLYGCGNNTYSEISKDYGDVIFFKKVPEVQNVKKIAAGCLHSLFLMNDGTLKAKGRNYYGQLGNGSTVSSDTLIEVFGLSNIVGISAGVYHDLALKSDSTVWIWGDNTFGQLGHENNGLNYIPQKLNIKKKIISVQAGHFHSLLLDENGRVWSFGSNSTGELGDSTNNSSTIPKRVNTLEKIIQISTEGSHNLALKVDGTVWGWGQNNFGELGIGNKIEQNYPVQLKALKNIKRIYASVHFSAAIDEKGNTFFWGDNSYGQLGDSTNIGKFLPEKLNKNIVDLELGYYHTLALMQDGSIQSWGYNYHGELGDSTFIKRNYPLPVKGLDCKVSVGKFNFFATKNTCTNYQFYSNSLGTHQWSFESGKPDASSLSNPEVEFSTPGTYKVILVVTKSPGVKDSIEQNITVTETKVELTPFKAVCTNDFTINLSGGSPSGGTYSGKGVTNGKFYPFVAGVGNHPITYTYTGPDGCTSSAEQTIKVEDCTGINQSSINNIQLKIFPNPGSGRFVLSVNHSVSLLTSKTEIFIKDLIGRVMFQQTLTFKNSEAEIDLKDQPKGIYILEITMGDEKLVKKLILE